MVGRIYYGLVVGMKMGERFLGRMLNQSQEVPGKDAWETLPCWVRGTL